MIGTIDAMGVLRVVKALQRDGLIYTVANLGSFVADPETGGAPKVKPSE
jgi:DNA-binding transcriptional regulator YhcF (GntR family)